MTRWSNCKESLDRAFINACRVILFVLPLPQYKSVVSSGKLVKVP